MMDKMMDKCVYTKEILKATSIGYRLAHRKGY